MSRSRRAALIAAIFAALAAFYAATFDFRNLSDAHLNGLQSRALALHGDIDVSRYDVPVTAFAYPRKGRLYSIYGVGVSVVSLPAYAVLARTGASNALLQGAAVVPFVAAAVVAMWLLLSRLAPKAVALAGTIAFGFGTPMWPLAAMALYQHASVALFHVVGIGGFLSRGRRGAILAGAGLGAAAFVRLPAAVPLAVVGLYYLATDRRAAGRYVIGAALPVAALIVSNRLVWGSWLTGGYSQAAIGFQGDIAEGLWGLVFGWWRGLLVYSPFLGLGILGIAVAARRWRDERARRLLVLGASALVSILLYARWSTWHGGLNQFGYRYLLDVVPFLIVLAVYTVTEVPRLRPVGGALVVVSVMTMAFGSLPNRFGWDVTWFATDVWKTSFGQAWIEFINRPFGGLLRLAGVSALAALMWIAGRPLPATDDVARTA